MLVPPAPQPRYRKALAFVALPVGLVLGTTFALSSLPGWIGWMLGFEHRANVGRNIRIKKS